MHFCAAHCTTLIWDKDHFTNQYDPGNAVWKVESFTRESVIIRRTDLRPRPFNAVYKGKISDSGDTIDGDGYKFTRGAALGKMPGGGDPPPGLIAHRSGPQSNPQVIPYETVFRTLAGLFGNSGGGGGDDGGGDPDLPKTISRIKDQREAARSECGSHGGRNARDPSPSCARADQLDERLSSAITALNEEIKDLQDARGGLSEACTRKDQQACQKLAQVDQYLARDRDFKMKSLITGF
jgi:hypothetical protein